MIVCVCRALNEDKVKEAVCAGAVCPNSVMAHHGTRFNCGQCREEMSDVICQTRSLDEDTRSLAAE